jgi:hypothetical protein
MGVDLTAIGGLRRTPCEEDRTTTCMVHARFSFGGEAAVEGSLLENVCYSAETVESYRVGSYTWYSTWHDAMCELAKVLGGTVAVDDAKAARRLPFAELVQFNDIGATFGPEASQSLAADFAAWDWMARLYFDADGYGTYVDFKAAFRVAAGTGAVILW